MDKRLYSTLINACAKVGRMQSAVAVVGEMRARGIEADVITYNTLLDGWAKRGDVWEAADVIEQMQAAGVAPDTTSFCLLIYACMKVRAYITIEDLGEKKEYKVRLVESVPFHRTSWSYSCLNESGIVDGRF